MSKNTFRRHIVLHAIRAWGHNKPLITIAILIAEARKDVVLTLLTNNFIYPKVMGELAKLPQERYKAIEAQINVLDLVPPSPDPLKIDVEIVPAFEQLFKQTGNLTCLSSGKTVNCSDLPQISLAIVDPFAKYLVDGVRAIATTSGSQVPILAWLTGSVGALIYFWGPEKLGGKGDDYALIRREMNETGRNQVDLYLEIIAATNGEIAQVPGYPPLYDYELYPQQVPDMSVQGSVIFTMMGAESIEASDGVICIATSALERETVIACKDYYKSVGKEFFTIGPMSMIRTPEQHENEVTSQVVLFLDKIQAELGEKSVIYISFGTFWWPSDPTIFEAIIKELVSLKMPFILSHPSPLCQFSDELRQIISESPYALELVWSPQERILTHPATGWFLTHGGWNSVQEALEYKVPLIFWPFGADQPLNSALITCQHKAGFELLEVRTGEKGKQKPYRCKDESCPSFTVDSGTKEVMDLLQELKGEKGRTVRTNWEDLANQCGKVWEENGEARLELFRLLEKYLD